MLNIISSVGSVGAGVSQSRSQDALQLTQLTDQDRSFEGLASAALQLIRSAVAPGSPGHDLDVQA